MNEMLSSSIWPDFPTSRENLNEQFSMNSINTWQPINATSDLYAAEDFINVWSPKTETNKENEKESFIKSIWSPSASGTDTSSIGSGDLKLLDETPTNSPSIKRSEIINCNDRWGSVIINQITPWKVIEIDDCDKGLQDPMVWRAKVDGTEEWEEYYLRQHGRRRPQIESSFNGDSVWHSTNDLSQSSNSIWPRKNNDANISQNDGYLQNTFSEINNRSNFYSSNGVRPSMTRNQAQKYLIDMGYSLSDAIGALVNNQMDLPKAINELQSKYRIRSSTITTASTSEPNTPNSMYTPILAYNTNGSSNNSNTRPADLCNMARMTPSLIGQNNVNLGSMMPSNYSNYYDMFHSDIAEQQIFDSTYPNNMDHRDMSQYGRVPDLVKRQYSMPLTRDSSYRNTSLTNNNNNRNMPSANMCGPYGTADLNSVNQAMTRMTVNYNGTHPMMPPAQNGSLNTKWSSCNSNGYNAMHPSATTNNNNHSMMLNSSLDPRHNYAAVNASGPVPNTFARSLSKQQIYQRGHSNVGWHNDVSSISPNGALNDINQMNLAKNMQSCVSGLMPDSNVGIIVRKVPSQHIEMIRSICFDSGAITNFQLQPNIQSIIVHFSSISEARRCMGMLQSQLNSRVELITDDYLLPGAI